MRNIVLKLSVLYFILAFPTHADQTSKDGFVTANIISSNCIKPFYPKDSLLAGEQGVSMISLHIDLKGNVTEAKVKESSGYTALDETAIKMFSPCKFTPATQDGQPVASWKDVKYNFKIKSS